MPKLIFNNTDYDCRDTETVLETLQRHGVDTAFSCRSGICHTCLLRSEKGIIPEKAQRGLKDSLRKRGYFLACKCLPQEDMAIALPREADLFSLTMFSPAIVYAKEILAPDIVRLLLEPATSLYYHAGQFINLKRPDGVSRSYSLVSVPSKDYFLEFHVKRIPNGTMSNWIFDELKANDEVEIQGPRGFCYYYPNKLAQNLLLIGTGTGLAPLIGIINDALQNGHTGTIQLYHGSRFVNGLYLQDTLRELSKQYSNFFYTPCLSGNSHITEYTAGRADNIAFSQHPTLEGWRVYLCGIPAMVYAAEKTALATGASNDEIHIDPYLPAPDSEEPSAVMPSTMEHIEEARFYPDPDPEIWDALQKGALLTKILADFYQQVFKDPRLASFFDGVTERRAIEKQYNFLRQVFTGEKVYFGDRPRNAHHWMVISDELFDYREELMASCLRNHGLAEFLVKRWRAAEEIYRKQIVKSKPWNKIIEGISYPVEGFDELILSYGTLCDNCHNEVSVGEKVRYHVRLGTVYCKTCMED
ncbi:MAG: 2Fe-2S iron-sulfur cluster binding domain-containing protein [Gammaproteobacteria bacterium]|nr:2Fe-2S iron-sulfur cluster binding domain-containing protein [Gammaproteobacteria bacterium]